ncbi:deoxycytidylate deaminase isoform X2 [Phocoena sinus]|uniref:deoxycytidylate deaminase isoform X2 n=1 Tax=Phocoena sinus TaxID=42100 RepID=UPI0013C4E29A|nr:deoxycytidylate deaminase isoform X2 [Phocoena sinus]
MQLRGICASRAAPPRPTQFAACQQTPPARNSEPAPATSQARSRGPSRFPLVLPRKKPSMSEFPCKKRDDYLEWPEYFMAVAFLSAQRSKDPNSQVGACIVNAENKIVGIGYNGMPNGCSDDLLPWRRTAESILDTKYPYGIKEVIFMSDKYHDSNETRAARLMLEMAGVSFRKFTPKCSQIVIDFDSINSRPSQTLQ